MRWRDPWWYVRDVQEPVLVLVLFVDGAHQRGGRRQHLVDEDEDGLLGGELDALANNIDELADCEVGGNEILLLIDSGDIRLLDLFANHLEYTVSCVFYGGRVERETYWNTIGVLLANPLGLGLALLESVFILETAARIC